MCGHVFVFRGRRGDLIKLLWFDGDGLCLFSKRLERGRFYLAASDERYRFSRCRTDSGSLLVRFYPGLDVRVLFASHFVVEPL
jgi:transposase